VAVHRHSNFAAQELREEPDYAPAVPLAESTQWRRDALRETAVRFEAGYEVPVEWAAAKRELRKLAEQGSGPSVRDGLDLP
jgi:hypothetical protein